MTPITYSVVVVTILYGRQVWPQVLGGQEGCEVVNTVAVSSKLGLN